MPELKPCSLAQKQSGLGCFFRLVLLAVGGLLARYRPILGQNPILAIAEVKPVVLPAAESEAQATLLSGSY
jgi:hypothetical protein